MVLASGRAAAALERCSYGQTGGCCCKPPERTEEPAVQPACCCVPELDDCVQRPADPGPPPPSDSAAISDDLPSAGPPDAPRGALAETEPFDPSIARYLLIVSLRR